MTFKVTKNTNVTTPSIKIDDILDSPITLDTGKPSSLGSPTVGGQTKLNTSDITDLTTSQGDNLTKTSVPIGNANDDVKTPIANSEVITISSPGTVSDILLARGIDQNQPEILASIQFVPTKNDTGKTPAGDLLDLQFSLRSLKTDDAAVLIAQLAEDVNLAKSITGLQNNYQLLVSSITGRITALSVMLDKMIAVENALDIKDNAIAIQQGITNLRTSRGAQTSQGNSTVVSTTPPLGLYSLLHDIFVCHLKFSDEAYNTFSNSKIFAQLLIDLRTTLENYSPQLLGSFVEARSLDRDPLALQSKPVKADEFSFSISDLSSQKSLGTFGGTTTTDFSPSDPASFNSFLNSLPSDEISRIKILAAALSKELRMSAGVGRLTGQSLDTKYSFNDLNFLSRMIGEVGNSAVGIEGNEGALLSIERLSDGAGGIVLPFEKRLVTDSINGKSYTPGSVYFVDTILKSQERPNISPLEKLSVDVSTAASDVCTSLSFLLNFDDLEEKLHCTDVIDIFYTILNQRIQGMGGDQRATTSDYIKKSAALSFALMSAAQSDSILKNLLYQYVKEIQNGTLFVSKTSDAADDVSGDTGIIFGDDNVNYNKNVGDILTVDTGIKINDFSDSGINKKRRGANPKSFGSNPVQTSSASSTNSVIPSVFLPSEIEARVLTLFSSTSTRGIAISKGMTSIPLGVQLDFVPGEIETILNGGSADSTTTFTAVTAIFTQLLQAASNLSVLGPNLTPGTAKFQTKDLLTNSNKLSNDALLLLVFEIVCSISSEFVSAYFDQLSNGNSTLTVTVNVDQNTSISSKMAMLSNNTTSYTILPAYTTIATLLESVRTSLSHEDSLMRDLVDTIKSIAETIKNAANVATLFFKNKGNNAISPDIFDDIFSDETAVEILKNLSRSQIVLSWQALSAVFQSSDEALYPDDQLITLNQKNALETLLKEPEFSAAEGSNVDLLVVGLPDGTLDALQNPSFTIGIDKSLESPTADLLTLSIYKRDPRYADIAFKPMKFLFDASRFVDLNFSLASSNQSFDDILNAMTMRDVGVVGLIANDKIDSFANKTEYDVLSNAQSTTLFENHVKDFLLKIYIRLLTGMNFSEYYFMSDDKTIRGNTIDLLVQDFLNAVIRTTTSDLRDGNENSSGVTIAGQTASSTASTLLSNNTLSSVTLTGPTSYGPQAKPLNPQLSSPTQTQNTSTAGEDVSTTFEKLPSSGGSVPEVVVTPPDLTEKYLLLFNSLLFKTSDQKLRVEQPKLFERIFTIAVDPDEFLIDQTLTNASPAGIASLANLFSINLLEEVGDVDLKIASVQGEAVFAEYFVVVEQGANL